MRNGSKTRRNNSKHRNSPKTIEAKAIFYLSNKRFVFIFVNCDDDRNKN